MKGVKGEVKKKWEGKVKEEVRDYTITARQEPIAQCPVPSAQCLVSNFCYDFRK
ncbi:hypothetical protein [Paenibacillus lentus]|uniref:hypothetical protein n=1 Tax=Paenibacillus lentus TaxID=1338368 RepID=UPI0013DE4BC9|nr:hypothetical protein [Paenibacillus lentus]